MDRNPIDQMKALLHLLNFRDQSQPYTGYPHYGAPLTRPPVMAGTKPPTFDHWAHAMKLPIRYSTAAR